LLAAGSHSFDGWDGVRDGSEGGRQHRVGAEGEEAAVGGEGFGGTAGAVEGAGHVVVGFGEEGRVEAGGLALADGGGVGRGPGGGGGGGGLVVGVQDARDAGEGARLPFGGGECARR